ncbi:MAG: hydrolase, partial [Oscillospiraceae bacterium]|nr:hydrolase [Oscillospiraceae bacterium]
MMKLNLKRMLSLLLALTLLGGLFACGKREKEPDAEGSPDPGTLESVEPSTEPSETPAVDPEPQETVTTPEVPLVAWGKNQVVEHLFFHPVIAYPQWAFHDCDAPESERTGLDDWMVTVDEYNKILQSVYDKGYVLVSMNEVWSEYTDPDTGVTRMRRNTIMVPEGKKPLIISFDDTNYYDYMLEQGFTSKLVLGTDGEIWAECTDPYTKETFLTQDLDAITILDKFIREHPDFSPNGVKGCLSLTGYQGILGYRTQRNTTDWNDEKEAFRLSEREAVMPIVRRLKETGWYFGSHTWGHIRLGTKSLETIQADTERWFRDVGELVGETSILFYPHGERPDKNDWTNTGPVFKYLQSQG